MVEPAFGPVLLRGEPMVSSGYEGIDVYETLQL